LRVEGEGTEFFPSRLALFASVHFARDVRVPGFKHCRESTEGGRASAIHSKMTCLKLYKNVKIQQREAERRGRWKVTKCDTRNGKGGAEREEKWILGVQGLVCKVLGLQGPRFRCLASRFEGARGLPKLLLEGIPT